MKNRACVLAPNGVAATALVVVFQIVALSVVQAGFPTFVSGAAQQAQTDESVLVLRSAILDVTSSIEVNRDSIRVEARLLTRENTKAAPSRSNPATYSAAPSELIAEAVRTIGFSTGNMETEPRLCVNKAVREQTCPFRDVAMYVALHSPDISGPSSATVHVITTRNSYRQPKGGPPSLLGSVEQVLTLRKDTGGVWKVIARRQLYGT